MQGISSTTTSQQTGATQKAGAFFDTARGQRFLKALSDTTGISQDDLKTQIAGGTSVSDILQSKGVTADQFRQALAKANAGADAATAGRQVRSHHHHHHGGDAEGAEQAVVSTLAGKLGMQPADLQKQLAQGGDLSKIAADKGLSQADLNKALQATFQSLTSYGTGSSSPASQGALINVQA